MAVHTESGIPCACCGGKEETEFVAILPLMAKVEGSDQKIVAKEPHAYSVGKKCYKAQWAEKYPNADPAQIKDI